jgi:ribonuclease BN (tRNA processing enzyme)
MSNAYKRQAPAVALLFVFAWHSASFAQSAPATKTQVVMLGTGTPLPDPDRLGPSTAVVVNGTAYIVDVGTGVVRRAAVARDKGVKALEPTSLRIAFLTHLHADHTLGLPDLISHSLDRGQKRPAGAVWSSGNARDGGAHFAGLRCRHQGTN